MAKWRDRIYVLLGTSFYLGYLPGATGTFGALPGVAIYWLIAAFAAPWLQVWLLAAALAAVCALTVALSPWAERYWKKKDPGIFVTDEVAGFLGTVLLFRTDSVLLTILWAFGVTRVVDIVKVPPARQLERLPGGWGILADDLLSSLYSAGLLHLLRYFLPHWVGSA